MVLGNKDALAATYIVRRRDVILTVVEEVGEAAETNKKLGALLDTTIPLSDTYNIRVSIIGNTSMKCQSFQCVEEFSDRRALSGDFFMLIEQRIAVIGGTREIGFTVRAKDCIRWLGE